MPNPGTDRACPRGAKGAPWDRQVCPLRALGVAAEDAEEVGDLAEVVERVDGDGGIGASQEVQVEEVFPGLAAQRARFNLDHVEIAQEIGRASCRERVPVS